VVFTQPRLTGTRRRIEQQTPLIEEEDAIGVFEHAPWSLLRDDDGYVQRGDELEERVGCFRIELGRRFVEDQQLRFERKRRCETDPLQLASRKLGHGALRKVLGADCSQGSSSARGDLVRRDAEILEPERNLTVDSTEHDLLLGILEDGRNRSGELGGPSQARVATGNLDAALEASAVKVRHEACERS
jgi:hypothetical protein